MAEDCIMDYKIIEPIWENDKKERIVAVFEYENGQRAQAHISKDSPDWERALQVRPIDELDRDFEARLQRHLKRREVQEAEHQRRIEREKQERLFQCKLETFEIELIRNSKDRKMKSMIRKAKSETEVLLYASVIVNRELDKE